MTGQELLDNALENLGVSISSLGLASTDAADAWALRRVNRVVRRFYYWLRSSLKDQRRFVAIEKHTFRAFNEGDYPDGQEDLNLFALEENIIDIRVKYSADGEYVLAHGFDQATSSLSEEEWARSGSALYPRFTLAGPSVAIFPKPTEDIAEGIVLRKVPQIVVLTTLAQSIESTPLDAQWVLVPLMEKAIYERLKNWDAAKEKELEYRRFLKDVRAEFSGRKGDNVDQPVERRVYT